MTDNAARRLWEDWIDIWRSEAAAAASDRGRAEAWSACVAIWAEAARLAAPPAAPDATAGSAGAMAPAGPASAGVAPDGDSHELASLARRVAELERRLAGAGGTTP